MMARPAVLVIGSALLMSACGSGLRYSRPASGPALSQAPPTDQDRDEASGSEESQPEAPPPEPQQVESAQVTPMGADPAAAQALKEATSAEESGALIESRRLLLQLVRAAPDSAESQEAALRLAEEAASREDWEKAVGWSVVSRLADDDAAGKLRRSQTLAIAYEGQGDYEAAAREWGALAQLSGVNDDAQILGAQARTLLLSQQTEIALELLEVHAIDPSITDELLSGSLPGEGLQALTFSPG
ncbi:MAG: hypothetical protein VX938_00910, partial [Myxococcota bacterium]|nr:hypothetical protein [Myxococcota bacterium]